MATPGTSPPRPASGSRWAGSSSSAWSPTAPSVPVHPTCRAVTESAAATLAELGHDVRPVTLPPAAAQLGPVLAEVIAGHLAAACADLEARTGRRASADTLEPAVLELAERGRAASAVDVLLAEDRLRRMQRDLAAFMDEVDVVLTPTTALPAPRLGVVRTDGTAVELFGQIVAHAPFTGLFNVTGGPALSLPWGVDDGGVPLGVQLAGAPGDDGLITALAAELEAGRPADRTPPRPGFVAASVADV